MTFYCLIGPGNLHDDATLTTSVSPETGYPIDNTKDRQRSRVWLSSDATDQYVSGTYEDGIERTASWFTMHRHLCHGGEVRVVLYSDDGWSSIVYDSGYVSITQLQYTTGFKWGINDADPRLRYSPFGLRFDATAHLSFRYYFRNFSSPYDAVAWQVCRFFLGEAYVLPYTAQYGHTLGIADQTERNRSRGGSLRTNRSETWREMTLDVKRVPDDDLATWLQIMEECGTGVDFPFSLFDGDDSSREREQLLLATFKSLDPLTRWHLQYTSKRIQLEGV